ncbi:unnamed protein product [Polarella glacialis]|uniref:Reverse transcriptase domain-containing protein n=1 Tax=Polarella glacialis TaxID=89957 RepID=A0A813EYW8_POLGL|nr:unnamed protein product [Polarella glacialis]
MLYEKANEWQLPFWTVAVDFKKAFDTVEHSALWQALSEQGVEQTYINVLRAFYTDQTGVVATDKTSKQFNIQRGTKQGDPISPILFNAVLEMIMRRLKVKWQRQQLGFPLGGRNFLHNLRFADDVLLFGESLDQVKITLNDLAVEAGKVGLELHMGKTKILANSFAYSRPSIPAVVSVCVFDVEVLSKEGSTKYLGRKLSFIDYHEEEINYRIACGWRKFMANKKELCDKTYGLGHRLRLFSARVTPSVLYGSGCWTMNTDRESTLRTAQRKMLRMMMASGRRLVTTDVIAVAGSSAEEEQVGDELESGQTVEEEDWVTWITRVTHFAENQLRKIGVKDWVAAQREKKWQWAGHVARRTDGRWSTMLAAWTPEGEVRRQGRPCTRWADSIDKVFGSEQRGDWFLFAQDRPTWSSYEATYVSNS